MLQTEFGAQSTHEMLELFLRDTPARIIELRQAWARSDIVYLVRLAHMMGGSCGIFGLAALREACLRLESLGASHAPAGLAAGVEEISRKFAVVRPALEQRAAALARIVKAGG